MNSRRIVIDGKVYNSVDEMPADVRQRYEQALSSLKDQNGNAVPDVSGNMNNLADTNGDGIPDLVENSLGSPIVKAALKIMMNGREFHSIDDLPPEARAKYEQAMSKLDANHNGIPDMLENNANASSVNSSVKFLVNGQEVNSLDNLPPEVRARYEQAMNKVDANHNGVPDFMEGMMNASASQIQQTSAPVSANFGIPTSQPISSTSISSNSAITPDTSNGWLLGLLVLGLLFLCALGAAGVWYFFLR
jgi:hypothetical protein